MSSAIETNMRQTTFIIEKNNSPKMEAHEVYTVRPNPETCPYEKLSRFTAYGKTPLDALENMLQQVDLEIDVLRSFRYHIASKIIKVTKKS